MKKKISINLISVIILVVAIVAGIIIQASNSVKNSVVKNTELQTREYMAEGDPVEATEWADLSQNKGNMAVYGAIWNESRTGLWFDGIDDYVKLGKYPNTIFTDEVTFETNKLDGTQNVLSNIDNGGFSIVLRNGQIRVIVSQGTNNVKVLYYNGLEVNTKYTVQVVKDENYVKLYVNGELADSGEYGMWGVNNEMLIGAKSKGNDAETNFFSGEVYAVRLYDRVLTEEELTQNYNLIQNLYNENAQGQVEDEITGYADDASVQLDGRKTERTKYGDLSLRTFVSKINNEDLMQSREPNAQIEENRFVYKHTKEAFSAFKGDKLTLTFRVYNEGDFDSNAEKINVYVPEYLRLVVNEDTTIEDTNEVYGWKQDENNSRLYTSTYLSNDPRIDKWGHTIEKDNTIPKYSVTEGLKYREVKMDVEVVNDLNEEEIRQTVLAEVARETYHDIDSTPNSVRDINEEFLENYKSDLEDTDENSYVIGYEDDDDFEVIKVFKEINAELELNKVAMMSENNIGGGKLKISKITETRSELKVLNKETGEDLEKDNDGCVNVPECGIIISVTPMSKGQSVQLLIEEESAPDGYKRVVNNLVLEITIGQDGNPVGKILSVVEKSYDANGNETTKTVEGSIDKAAKLNNEDENGVATGTPEQNNLKIQYKIGEDGEWREYNGEFEVEENCTIYAKSSDDKYTSSTTIHNITNIDKVLPTITEIEQQEWEENKQTKDITARLDDNASGLAGYAVTDVETQPENWIAGNRKLYQRINIEGIVKGGIYYIWVKDIAGNVNHVPLVVDDRETPPPVVAEIVKYPNNTALEGTQYQTLEAAIAAVAANDTAEIKILCDINNEANRIDNNKDITLNLNGLTVNNLNKKDLGTENDTTGKQAFYIADGKFTIIDKNNQGYGKIYADKEEAIFVSDQGTLTIGINEGVVLTSEPCIEGKQYGVENQGLVYFYDGIIIGETALKLIDGEDIIPAEDHTVFISDETDTKESAVLQIMSNVEARIGRKYFTLLEDAITAAQTEYGQDGSQVPIVIVKDLYKEETVLVDETKNIKLDLNGHTLTTGANGPALNNKGKLEIFDSEKLDGTFDISYKINKANNNVDAGKVYTKTFNTSNNEESNYVIELTGENMNRDIEIYIDGNIIYNLNTANISSKKMTYSVYTGVLEKGEHELKILINDGEGTIKNTFDKIRVTNTIGGGRIIGTSQEAIYNNGIIPEEGQSRLSNLVNIGYNYYFDYEGDELVPSNEGLEYSIAKSYYVIDLTDKPSDHYFYITGDIKYHLTEATNSSLSYRDTQAYVSNGSQTTTYVNSYGDYYYIALSEQNDIINTIPHGANPYYSFVESEGGKAYSGQTYEGEKELETPRFQGGKKYYLHIVYANNSGAYNPDDMFRISNLTLNDLSTYERATLVLDDGIYECTSMNVDSDYTDMTGSINYNDGKNYKRYSNGNGFVAKNTAILNEGNIEIKDAILKAPSYDKIKNNYSAGLFNVNQGNAVINGARFESSYYGVYNAVECVKNCSTVKPYDYKMPGTVTIYNANFDKINVDANVNTEYEINTPGYPIYSNAGTFGNRNIKTITIENAEGVFINNFSASKVGRKIALFNTTAEINNGYFPYAEVNIDNANVTINNGDFNTDIFNQQRHFGRFSVLNGSNVTINDGNFKDKGIYVEDSSLKINGGDFSVTNYNSGCYNTTTASYGYFVVYKSSFVDITNGDFTQRTFSLLSNYDANEPNNLNKGIKVTGGSLTQTYFALSSGIAKLEGGTFTGRNGTNLVREISSGKSFVTVTGGDYNVYDFLGIGNTTFTMTGGTVTASRRGIVSSVDGNASTTLTNNINLNGGSITSVNDIFYNPSSYHKTNINVTSGTYTSTEGYGIYLNQATGTSGSVVINGGKIDAYQNAINDSRNGISINVKAGELISRNADTVYVNPNNTISDNNVIIGVKNEENNTEINDKPVIKANKDHSAINIPHYRIKWYDGYLYGNPDTILNTSIDEIETNTEIVHDYVNVSDDSIDWNNPNWDGTKVYKRLHLSNKNDITKSVCKIANCADTTLVDREFTSLNDAIAAVGNNNTLIELLDEVSLGNIQTIGNAQNITIDNNNKKVYAYRDNTFENNGTFRIQNLNIPEGESAVGYRAVYTRLVNNNNNFTIGSGTYIYSYQLKADHNTIVNNDGKVMAIEPHALIEGAGAGRVIYNEGVINSGGDFKGDNSFSRVYQLVMIYNTKELNTTEGTFTLTGYNVCGIKNEGEGEIDVDSTTFKFDGIYSDNTINDGKALGSAIYNNTNKPGNIVKDSIFKSNTEEGTVEEQRAQGIYVKNTSNGRLVFDNLGANVDTLVENDGELYISNSNADPNAGIEINFNHIVSDGGKTYIDDVVMNTINNNGQINITNEAEITITNTTVNAHIIAEENSKVNIVDSTVYVLSGNAIDANNSTVKVVDRSDVRGANYAIAGVNNSTIELGKNENPPDVNIENPYVRGNAGAISTENSNFNFYDGVVVGNNPDTIIAGAVADKPTDYNPSQVIEVTEGDEPNVKTIYMQYLVSQRLFRLNEGTTEIGTYNSVQQLQEALDDLDTSKIYGLTTLENIYISNADPSITFKAGSKVTWDLNGKRIRSSTNNTIVNNGVLTITNTGNKVATDKVANLYNDSDDTFINNTGDLTIINTGMTLKGSRTVNKITTSDSLTIKSSELMSFEIQEDSQTTPATLMVNAIYNSGDGDVSIDENTYISRMYIRNNSTGDVEIKDSTVYAGEYKIVNYSCYELYTMIDNINSGDINFVNSTINGMAVLNNGSGDINYDATTVFEDVNVYNYGTGSSNLNQTSDVQVHVMEAKRGNINVEPDITFTNRYHNYSDSGNKDIIVSGNAKMTFNGAVTTSRDSNKDVNVSGFGCIDFNDDLTTRGITSTADFDNRDESEITEEAPLQRSRININKKAYLTTSASHIINKSSDIYIKDIEINGSIWNGSSSVTKYYSSEYGTAANGNIIIDNISTDDYSKSSNIPRVDLYYGVIYNGGVGTVTMNDGTVNYIVQAYSNNDSKTIVNAGTVRYGLQMKGGYAEVNNTKPSASPTTIKEVNVDYPTIYGGPTSGRNIKVVINDGSIGKIGENSILAGTSYKNDTSGFKIYINGGHIGESKDSCAISLSNYYYYSGDKYTYGKLYIGENDGTVNNTPTILGWIEGTNKCTLNYYDGTIESTLPYGVKGYVDEVADQHMMVSDYNSTNDDYIVSLKSAEPILEVNGTIKNSVKDATYSLNPSGNNTMKLLRDIILTSSMEIPQGTTTFNLNGNKIYSLMKSDYSIINSGDLTITDGTNDKNNRIFGYRPFNLIKNNSGAKITLDYVNITESDEINANKNEEYSLIKNESNKKIVINKTSVVSENETKGKFIENDCEDAFEVEITKSFIDSKALYSSNKSYKGTLVITESEGGNIESADSVDATDSTLNNINYPKDVVLDNTTLTGIINTADHITMSNGSEVSQIANSGKLTMSDSTITSTTAISQVTSAKLNNVTVNNDLTVGIVEELNNVTVSGTFVMQPGTHDLTITTLNAGHLTSNGSNIILNPSNGYKIHGVRNNGTMTIKRGTYNCLRNYAGLGSSSTVTMTIEDAILEYDENYTGTAASAIENEAYSTNAASPKAIITIDNIDVSGNYGYGILAKGGSRTTLKDGTIYVGMGEGIYAESTANVIIGTKGSGVDTTTPSVTGSVNGVKVSGTKAKVEFYDGVITGSAKAIEGTITDVETNYKIVVTSDGKQARLRLNSGQSAAAFIGQTSYSSLSDAVDGANTYSDDVTIRIERDIQESQPIQINKNIKINLNTNKITFNGSSALLKVNTGATLSVTDEVQQDDEIIATPGAIINNGGPAIELNGGSLKIGIDDNIYDPSTPRIMGKNGNFSYGSSTYGALNVISGTLNMYDGTISDIANGNILSVSGSTIIADAGKAGMQGLKDIKALADNELGEELKKVVKYISSPRVSHTPTYWTNQNVTVTMGNSGRLILNIADTEGGFDLALREYITKVNDEALDTSREPVVDSDLLQGLLDRQTGNYKQIKKYVHTVKNDVVTERINVFNEGTVSGYASEIVKYLPEGLDYIADNQTNIDNGWQVAETDSTTGRVTAIKTSKLSDTLISASDNQNSLLELLKHTKTLENIPSVEVALKVSLESENVDEIRKDATTRTEISASKDSLGNQYGEFFTEGTQKNTDIDSTPDNIEELKLDTYYEDNYQDVNDSVPAYYAGEEDDDDSETIYVGPPDYDRANLTVLYLDYYEEENTERRVLDTKEIRGYVGDNYNEPPKEIAGYQLVEVDDEGHSIMPSAQSGKLTLDPIEIRYYYKKIITVTTRYEDQEGNELKPEDSVDKLENDSYTTAPADIDNYVLARDDQGQPILPENASGTATYTVNTDGTINTEIVVTYKYIKVSHGVIEKHIDIKSDELIIPEILHEGNVGDTYETHEKEFDGYTLVRTIGEGDDAINYYPENATGTMPDSDEPIQVKYYYLSSASLRVRYVDQVGASLTDDGLDIVEQGYEGKPYTTEEKTFAEYELVEVQGEANGTMTVKRDETTGQITNRETVVTYVYRLADSGGVVIRHIDVINNVVLSKEEKSGQIREPYTSRNLTESELPGYVYVTTMRQKVVDDDGTEHYEDIDLTPHNPTGSMLKDTIYVNYYYRAKTTITVKYINELTNEEIIPEDVYNGYEGEAKEILPQNIEGYIITDDSQKGIVTYETQRDDDGFIIKDDEDNIIGNNVNVVFKYRQIGAEVVERHINIETNQVIEEIVHAGNVGDEYHTSPKDYQNMVLVESVEQIIDPEDAEEGEEVAEDGKVHRIINMLPDPEIANGQLTTEPREVNYYYRRGAKVVVKYYDVETNAPIPGVADTIKAGAENDEYTTEPKTIEGYRLVETPENANGTMRVIENPDGTFNYETIVIYKYRSTYSAGLKVYYRDIVTNELITEDGVENPEIISGVDKRDEHYFIDPLEFDGYVLVEEDEDGNSLLPKNQEGTYKVESQEMTFWYVRLASVKVSYIDRETNEEVLETEVIDGHENDKYITTAKDVDGYVLVEKPLNDVGSMLVTKKADGTFDTETEVTYLYSKVVDGVIEKHIDIKTDAVMYNEVHTGNRGDIYNIPYKEFTGYDVILVDETTGDPMTPNAVGVMGDELVEVKYYYIRKTKAIAEYRDIDTKERIDSDEVIEGHEGDEYTSTVKTFEGYTLQNVEGEANGTMEVSVNDDNTINTITKVVFEYKSNIAPEPDPEDEEIETVTNETIVNETIENTTVDNETVINETIENTIVENETIVNETIENTTVENETVINEVENTVVENETVVNETIENITVENETVENEIVNNTIENEVTNETTNEITNTIVDDETDEEEEDPTKSEGVLEKYIDINTDEVIEIVRHKGHIGDTYEITPKEIEGYDLVTTDKNGKTIMPTNTKGVMTKDAIDVVYYCVMKAYVRVQYINKNSGKPFIDDVIIEGHEADEYEIEEKEFDGYELVEKTDNYRGVFTVIDNKDGTFNKEIVVRFYYAKINEEVLPDTGEDVVKNAAYVLAFIANVTLAVIAFVKFRRQDRNEQ